MNCPNCNAERLLTVETFQTPTMTVRTKKCRECEWKFTSHETIADDLTIPDEVRQSKRRRAKEQQ